MSRSSTKVERQPKLFFVSTSSTTSTLQTASVCYATSGTPSGTCTGRRKRSIKIDGAPLEDVKPSQLNQEVQSSQDAKLDREGRFLLYWITTTSISTSTSYTVTVSISAATCTPASGLNIHWAVCAKWFCWYPPPRSPLPPSSWRCKALPVSLIQAVEWPLVDDHNVLYSIWGWKIYMVVISPIFHCQLYINDILPQRLWYQYCQIIWWNSDPKMMQYLQDNSSWWMRGRG